MHLHGGTWRVVMLSRVALGSISGINITCARKGDIDSGTRSRVIYHLG